VEPIVVEKGAATVVVVRQPNSREAEAHLGKVLPGVFVASLRLDAADHLGIVWPVVKADASDSSDLFEASPLFSGKDGGFFWLLVRMYRPGRADPPYRFADAVAVAGMAACASATRRAVVLVEGELRDDESRFSASQVRSYLARLGVPLRVWSLTGADSSPWTAGAPEDVSSVNALQKSVGRLKKDLDGQRIVWVAGEWAPGEVVLTSSAPGMELVR
jgi:hypothetical protein